MVFPKCRFFTLLVVLTAAFAPKHAEAFSRLSTMHSSHEFGMTNRLSARVGVNDSKSLTPTRSHAKSSCLGSKFTDHEESGKSTFTSWITNHKRSVAVTAGALSVIALTGTPSPALAGLVSSTGSLTSDATTMVQQLSQQLSDTGFYQAFSLVFVSELGDKTFFVAGLLAAKLSKVISFVGSLGALATMTIIAVLIGQIFHAVPSGLTQGYPLDDLCAIAAFTFFGIKILAEALESDDEGSVMDEELAEAEEAVEDSDSLKNKNALAQIASTFALVFAAEFGDRSFLSTIALSAAQNPLAVAGGSIAAHGIATGIAVIGGAYISKYLSEKVIGLIGGSLFIVFAITTAFGLF